MLTDMLGNSGVLRNNGMKREEFDTNNPKHLASAKHFLETGNWGEVQFYPELPYLNVPETVLRKLAKEALIKLGA